MILNVVVSMVRVAHNAVDIVLATQGYVLVVATNIDLIPAFDDMPGIVELGIHVGLFATPTDTFQLFKFIGQAKQMI